MPNYCFSSGAYHDPCLLGFAFVRPWQAAGAGPFIGLSPAGSNNYIALLISADSNATAQPGRAIGEANWGMGTLTNDAGGTLQFGGCTRVHANYGEYANEYGPGFVLATFNGLTFTSWTDAIPGSWPTDGPNTKSGTKRLNHTFSHGAAGDANFNICAPRVSYDGAGLKSVSFVRYFCDSQVDTLLTGGNPVAGWSLSGLGGVTPPAAGCKGSQIVCHGLFRNLGWHQFAKVHAAVIAGSTAELAEIFEEVVSTAGSLPRNLMNADDHQNKPNAPVLNEPAMEVLYWEL